MLGKTHDENIYKQNHPHKKATILQLVTMNASESKRNKRKKQESSKQNKSCNKKMYMITQQNKTKYQKKVYSFCIR